MYDKVQSIPDVLLSLIYILTTLYEASVLPYTPYFPWPLDVVTDGALPLWVRVLLALCKNPLKQRRMVRVYKEGGRVALLRAFASKLRGKEVTVNVDYHVRDNTHKHHRYLCHGMGRTTVVSKGTMRHTEMHLRQCCLSGCQL